MNKIFSIKCEQKTEWNYKSPYVAPKLVSVEKTRNIINSTPFDWLRWIYLLIGTGSIIEIYGAAYSLMWYIFNDNDI